jgi:TetR/AcrR family transcriptional regulator, transcriptional repressor for nem operon
MWTVNTALAYFFWLGWEGAINHTKLLKNATILDN